MFAAMMGILGLYSLLEEPHLILTELEERGV